MLEASELGKLQEISHPWPDEKPTLEASVSKWFGPNHESIFSKFCGKHPTGLYLELGTWTGAGSTRFVADRYPDITVICVDTFNGSAEHHRIPAYRAVLANLWEHFVANHWHNRNRLFPMRTDTVTAMKKVAEAGLKPDIVYVDAAHDVESVFNDVSTALACFPQAIIMGDDYAGPGKGHTGVREGLQKAMDEGLFAPAEFTNYHRIWYLRRNI